MPSSPPPLASAELLRLAYHIDGGRAAELESALGPGPGRALGVVIGSAFPALRASTGWQVDALDAIAQEGWWTARRREKLVEKLTICCADGDAAVIASKLRRAVWTEKVRIALRELLPAPMGGAPLAVTAAELSDLADAALEVALSEARGRLAARVGEPLKPDGQASRFVVVGMGKLGGRELNAGSDVDLVFFYDTDESASGLTPFEFWSRVARRLVETIEEPTGDGSVWRVDLRLRPEGAAGPLVNSLAAAERYYETWGRLWERAALLRARTVAGDVALGAELAHEIITPFVYRRNVDPSISIGLAELLERTRAEICAQPERDIKLGPGGIREAEFFVQTLQLIWGGQDPILRVRGTFDALARLRSRGLVTDREAREISAGYVLMRSLEHAIQWSSGIQTHLVPQSSEELARLSRVLGYSGEHALVSDLKRVRASVAELFASILPAEPAPAPRYQVLLNRIEVRDAGLQEQVERTFGVDISDDLASLARRPDGLLGALTRERYPQLADQVLDAILASSDPEQAARYLRSLFARLSPPGPYVALLAADPRALRRLTHALGASRFVGDAMVAWPDLSELVLVGGSAVQNPRDVLDAELELVRRRPTAQLEHHERSAEFVSATRRAKLRTMVGIAVADLAGRIGTREATRTLSELAEGILDEATRFALGGEARGLSVIAVGKLGGLEIGYGSDLDVLFVYDPSCAPSVEDAPAFFSRTAQRIIRLISEPDAVGRGYELDTRLRPSGSYGTLVTSFRSFARYHGVSLGGQPLDDSSPSARSSGAAWERQALLRARPCAGDRALGRRVLAIAHVAAYERGEPPAADMHHLRMRMERELGRERSGSYDLKFGRGGLLDVEFASQWLQMRHGKDVRVRTPETLRAIEALYAAGYLTEPHMEVLRDGYSFLRRLEQRIHVLQGSGASSIREDEPGLEQLARRMGLEDTARASARRLLIERYRATTSAVRAAYLGILGLPSEPPQP